MNPGIVLATLAAGTVAYFALKPKKAKAQASVASTPEYCTLAGAKAFNEYSKLKTGFYYDIYWVQVPLGEWQTPKGEYLANTHAIAFSSLHCMFFDWNGSFWERATAVNNAYWEFLGKTDKPECFTFDQLQAFAADVGGGVPEFYGHEQLPPSGLYEGHKLFHVPTCRFWIWSVQWQEDANTAAAALAWKQQQ